MVSGPVLGLSFINKVSAVGKKLNCDVFPLAGFTENKRSV